jgi:hypothetical protein
MGVEHRHDVIAHSHRGGIAQQCAEIVEEYAHANTAFGGI